MFRSLRIRNFRLYIIGQGISMAGTFMQVVAQAWLVLQLTGSGTALGLLTTLQFGPTLLIGGPAGVIIDRVPRRRLYAITEAILGLQAAALGILFVTGAVQLWMVYALALVFGVVAAVDQPTRQAFVLDLAGSGDLPNAIGLSMSVGSVSRAVGPALAGVTIAVVGVGTCFLLNALSFVAMLVALALMRKSELHPAAIEPRAQGQFREGLRYVGRAREVLSILLLLAVAFGIAWEFEVALPLVAKFTFDGNAATYGLLATAVGIGAVLGGLESARRGSAVRGALAISGAAYAAGMWCATFAPGIVAACIGLVVAGAGGIMLIATATARLQLRTIPRMRGRVMALYSVAIFGTRVIGGPIVGWFGNEFGARASLAIGAIALSVATPIWYYLAPHGPERVEEDHFLPEVVDASEERTA
jgi:MFS family permease